MKQTNFIIATNFTLLFTLHTAHFNKEASQTSD